MNSAEISVEDRPPSAHDPVLAAFLEEVSEVGEQHLQSSRLGLRLSATDLEKFRRRLHGLLDDYVRRPADPDGERWSLYLGMHPEA